MHDRFKYLTNFADIIHNLVITCFPDAFKGLRFLNNCMQTENDTMPAWLVCDGILSKARDELLSQAIRTVHEQIKKKRLSLEGEPVSVNEATSQQEKDMYFLGQLVQERERMEKQFAEYIEAASIGEKDRARIDELQQFLLALKQIALLYRYSDVCGAWLMDAEKELREPESAMLLASTASRGISERKEVLAYLATSKELENEGVFTDQEKSIIKRALELIEASTTAHP